MAEYGILIKSSAAKEIDAVDSKTERRRIVERIRTLADSPRGQGCEKLAGYSDRYRLRQGRFRIVYLIDDDKHEVIIFKVGRTIEVYR